MTPTATQAALRLSRMLTAELSHMDVLNDFGDDTASAEQQMRARFAELAALLGARVEWTAPVHMEHRFAGEAA